MLIFSVFSKDVSNTIGNVPVEWYNEYPHIGYDLRGEKILKPATGDEVSSSSQYCDAVHTQYIPTVIHL